MRLFRLPILKIVTVTTALLLSWGEAQAATVLAAGGTTSLRLSDYSAFSGMRFDGYTWGYLENGGYIEYVVSSATDARYNLVLKYATLQGDASAKVLINGAQQGVVSFPYTGSWDVYQNTQAVTLTLAAGQNRLRLLKNATGGYNIQGISLAFVSNVSSNTQNTGSSTSASVTVPVAVMQKDVGATYTYAGLYSHNVWSNGAVHADLAIATTGLYSLKVKAIGQSAGGLLPIMEVRVDGVAIKQFQVTTNGYADYEAQAQMNTGNHRVSMAFINDAVIGTEDRNLYINGLTIQGIVATTPTTPTTSTGSTGSNSAQAGNFKLATLVNTSFCMDIDRVIATNSTQVYIWTCIATEANQVFEFTSAGDIKIHGKCLDAYNGQPNDPLTVYDCHGQSNQKFHYDNMTKQLRGINNLCVTLNGAAANRSTLSMKTCDSSVAQKFNIAAAGATAPAPSPSPSPGPAPAPSPAPSTPVNGAYPLAGVTQFINPWTGPMFNRNNYCPQMSRMADTPSAVWMGGGQDQAADARDIAFFISEAVKQGNAVPTFVIYNIPNRDCGLYSAGGLAANSYPGWVENIARSIGNYKSVVILEPDSLPALEDANCMPPALAEERVQLLKGAISTFRRLAPNTTIYLDGGNPGWVPADRMADLLIRGGVGDADGFALNVSNFFYTQTNVEYGTQISSRIGGKHFVIDTSRNGNGPGDTWCNPAGRALGPVPQGFSSGLVDGYIWVKGPGGSDGTCGGAPYAGAFMPEYACDLARAAGW